MSKRVIQAHKSDVPVDETGTIIETSIAESTLLGVSLKAGDTADYAFDVSPDGKTYFENEETYTGVAELRSIFELTDRFVRVRVTGAASNGTTADVFIDGVQ